MPNSKHSEADFLCQAWQRTIFTVTIIFMNLSIVLSVTALIASLVCIFLLVRITKHYNALTKNVNKESLTSVLNDLLKISRKNKQEIDSLEQSLNKFIKRSRLHFQKIGFKRFNPFSHTGGDQSFIICLLDENDDGIVISSLHSRENTRLYAKQLTKGKSPDQILSKEEIEVINQAIKP